MSETTGADDATQGGGGQGGGGQGGDEGSGAGGGQGGGPGSGGGHGGQGSGRGAALLRERVAALDQDQRQLLREALDEVKIAS